MSNAALAEMVSLAVAQPAPILRPDFAAEAAIAVRNASLCQPTSVDLLKARERVNAVRLYVELRRKGHTRTEAAALIDSGCRSQFPILATAGHNGRSALTVYNLDAWAAVIRTGKDRYDYTNLAALADDYAKGRRMRAGDPTFWEILGAGYLVRNGPDLPEAYRTAVLIARAKGLDDAAIPTETQVRYWYRHNVDPAAVALARGGEEEFGAGFQFFNHRTWDNVAVNELWWGDHHDLDCPVKVWDEAKGGWAPSRCTLTAWLDAKSLYFVGWQLSVRAANNDAIQNAFAAGVCRAGMVPPQMVGMDNGADFCMTGWDTAVRVGAFEHSILIALGVQPIHSLPYRAQAKVIERMFGLVARSFAKAWVGYLGNRPGTRSEVAQYFWEHPEHLPTLEQLCQAFAAWLDRVYHERPGKGRILRGKCPREVWESRRETRAPWTVEALREAFLMPYPRQPTVRRGPSIQVDNRIYYAAELMPWVGRVGEAATVLVKRDRLDPEHVFCYHLDGRPICEARTRPALAAIARTEEDRARIAEGERLKRHQLQDAYTIVERETGGTYSLADPQDRVRMILDPGAYAIERVGDRASVKGGSHKFTYRRLAPAAPGADAPAGVLPFHPQTADSAPLPAPGQAAPQLPAESAVPTSTAFEFRETARERTSREKVELWQAVDNMLLSTGKTAGTDPAEEDRIARALEGLDA